MRILIIEDDSLSGEILQAFLYERDCSGIIADTIATAKELLNVAPFDFILLDNHLPDGDGINFLPFINSLSYRVPVIMITANDDQNIMVDAFHKGVDDFLPKPFNMTLLWLKIERCRALYDYEENVEQKIVGLDNLLGQQEQQEELARYLYEHIPSKLNGEIEHIKTYIQSASTINGDAFMCETAPNGNQFVMLADATGHGLSAAICILPMVSTIKAMVRKGLSLAHIVHECNKKLYIELPDDKFVTLIGVEINFHQETLHLFNAGMPDVIALMQDKSNILYPSTSTALGIVQPAHFDSAIITLQTTNIKHLFFSSDGLIEQPGPLGDPFGMQRVLEVLRGYNDNQPIISQVLDHLKVFSQTTAFSDDLSMCDLQLEKLFDSHVSASTKEQTVNPGRISATLNIEGGLIATADLIGLLDGIMQNVDMIGDLRQRAFTVFAELISNGLDHGILDLDSALKNDFAGFAEYIELKEQRLADIPDDANLVMELIFTPATNQVELEITDSGKGYDIHKVKDINDEKLSGRGVELINKLCKQVEVFAPGNKTKVTLKRET